MYLVNFFEYETLTKKDRAYTFSKSEDAKEYLIYCEMRGRLRMEQFDTLTIALRFAARLPRYCEFYNLMNAKNCIIQQSENSLREFKEYKKNSHGMAAVPWLLNIFDRVYRETNHLPS